jgi:hypothetical protein
MNIRNSSDRPQLLPALSAIVLMFATFSACVSVGPADSDFRELPQETATVQQEALAQSLPAEMAPSSPMAGRSWHVVILAGSYTDGDRIIYNWDNARMRFHRFLSSRDIPLASVSLMSAMPALQGTEFLGATIAPAGIEELDAAIAELDFTGGEGLILFISSHGSRDRGIWIETSRGRGEILEPWYLDEILDNLDSRVPILALLSACYSGQFIHSEQNITGPRRIILTAAREDRSSFGCGSGIKMPEWDDSLMDVLELVVDPSDHPDWASLARAVADEIAHKERNFDPDSRSHPQAWFPETIDESFITLLRQFGSR